MTTRAPSGLTQEQIGVIQDTEGPLLVEAGAGSGKTTVLIEKILYEMGISGHGEPEWPVELDKIAAITFTRKAAGEIRERLRGELLRRADEARERKEREQWCEAALRVEQANIGTIDAFAGRLIRDYSGLVHGRTHFEVLDPGEAVALMRRSAHASLLAGVEAKDPGATTLVHHFGTDRASEFLFDCIERADLLEDVQQLRRAGRYAPEALAQHFELAGADLLVGESSGEILDFAAQALTDYRAALDEAGAYDHTQVLLRALELAGDAKVQAHFRGDTRLLFVDEHQDTNRSQANLLFRLAGLPEISPDGTVEELEEDVEDGPRLVLVGDPKQGIYSFRHADITIWKRSREVIDQVGGTFHRLPDNHRSRPEVLGFVDSFMGAVMGRSEEEGDDFEVPYMDLRPGRPEHGSDAVEIGVATAADMKGKDALEEEAAAVARRIGEILKAPEDHPVFETVDGEEVERPVEPRDICILSRKLKGVGDVFERALRREGVDAYVYGGRGLYARSEIRDLATLLQAVADPTDEGALAAALRCPLLGLDDVSLMELAQAARDLSRQAREGEGLIAAVQGAEGIVTDPTRLERVQRARDRFETLRELRDRVPHADLVERAVERTDYLAFLAGAPDAPTGVRNVEKFLRMISSAGRGETFAEFVDTLAERIQRLEHEEEAPLYSPDDNLVTITTIHKAKGLEWPYVFLARIGSGLFHQVDPRRPHLSPSMGLALPLEVVERAKEGGEGETPALWGAFRDETHRRLYAEAKRLTYVALTRARDRLFLYGTLRYDNQPDALEGSVGGLARIGPEWWLRHVLPDVTQPPAHGWTVVSYGHPPRNAEVRWFGQAEAEDDEEEEEGAREETDSQDGAPNHRTWPRDHAGLAASFARSRKRRTPLPAVVERNAGPLHDRSLGRIAFPASELGQYVFCPWRHFFGYRAGVSSDDLQIRDLEVLELSENERGDILHAYLMAHEEEWSEGERKERLEGIVRRRTSVADSAMPAVVEALHAHVENVIRSPLWARIQRAHHVMREVPADVRLDEDTLATGTIDLLFLDDEGWTVVDFKSSVFGPMSEERLEKKLEAKKEFYRPQAEVYALALARSRWVDEERPTRDYVLFFTDSGKTKSFPLTPEWLEEAERHLREAVAGIRGGSPSRDPVYEEGTCESCPFFETPCHPLGAPVPTDEAEEETPAEAGGRAPANGEGEVRVAGGASDG